MQTTKELSYPELVGHQVRGMDAPPPPFPDTCPSCGAARVDPPAERVERVAAVNRGKTRAEVLNHLRDWRADYACGGMYVDKPQIQNHTEVFWGCCGAAGAERLAYLTR